MELKAFKRRMQLELEDKSMFEKAKIMSFKYIDDVNDMDVFPLEDKIEALSAFDEEFPRKMGDANEILEMLNQRGGPGTIAQTAGRFFGFVNGGAIPVSLVVKWLSDVWDQCVGLFLSSPINAKLEDVCQKWLVDILELPKQTVAGFVSGTSTANICALSAARYRQLLNQGWDVNKKGLMQAPPLRVIVHEQAHSSVKKALVLLGFGLDNIEWVPSDEHGRIVTDKLPELDNSCIVLLQAGNVNTGAFDDFQSVCERANEAGAWVHIDGAFGLWARASQSLRVLTNGMELADSWAVDGHKSLNTPYDSGIVLCKDEEALITSLQTQAAYINMTERREPILYTNEMSKRSRAIELWAVMKYLGAEGIDTLITGFNTYAKMMAEGLEEMGYQVLNDVVYNQVLVRYKSDVKTQKVLKYMQNSGKCWMGGSKWNGMDVIRVSICSWVTDDKDVRITLDEFRKAIA